MQIVLMIVLIVASIFLYKIPVIGLIVCLIGLTVAIKLIRQSNIIIGLVGLVISAVTSFLAFLIILITFNVIEPLDFNIGYDSNMTKVVTSMLIGDLSEEQKNIHEDIEDYVQEVTKYHSNGMSNQEAISQLFVDSSKVRIYYSSKTIGNLRDEVNEEVYDDIKSFVALRDSDVDYYLFDFEKLYEIVRPVRQLAENKRQYWLIDINGNIYLNVESMTEYLYGK